MMRWPAEWEPHEAVWIGFPGDPREWPVSLGEAQQEVTDFANAVSDDGAGEQVILVCRNEADASIAKGLVNSEIETVVEPFGDIWLRDTGPLIGLEADRRIANLFAFNGWGRKFEMAGDQDIGRRLSCRQGLEISHHDWILEGGAIDGDGSGWILTTEQCALNPNRNGLVNKKFIEQNLNKSLGCKTICWLGDGLKNDHTDGHIDNLARFVAPRTVAIPEAVSLEDPNRNIFEEAAFRAKQSGLDIVRLPSVGKFLLDREVAPASYMNFYVGNTALVIPQYQVSHDSHAVEELAKFFPDRKPVGLSSSALLRGGGSFHCISQQIPAILGQ